MLLYYGIIKVSSPETAKYTPTPIPPPTIIINKIISKITLQVLFPSSSVSVLNWVQNAEKGGAYSESIKNYLRQRFQVNCLELGLLDRPPPGRQD